MNIRDLIRGSRNLKSSILLATITLAGFSVAGEGLQTSSDPIPGEVRRYGWIYLGPASPSDRISFRVYPYQPRYSEFAALAEEVNNPRSEKYGQYLSQNELEEFLKPPESVRLEVERWLGSAGISMAACLKKWDNYHCKNIPVLLVERLLSVKFNSYRHDRLGNRQVIMTEDKLKYLDYPKAVKCLIGIQLGGLPERL